MFKLVEILVSDIQKMSLREHLYYWIIPLFVLAICFLFYFSENPQLVSIICPPKNREWGLLENLQLVIISLIFIRSLRTSRKVGNSIVKWGFRAIAVLALFVFLEETDYGAHFGQLIMGNEDSEATRILSFKNVHNLGNNAKIFKRSVYLIMAMTFVIAPFLKPILKNKYVNYILPYPRIIIIALLTIVSELVPRLTVYYNLREDGGLGVNIGEFSEIMVYYIFLIYIIQLSSKQEFQ